ncbi:hypothetical protein Hypma_014526, partial [Hypsizygus marmoreus]
MTVAIPSLPSADALPNCTPADLSSNLCAVHHLPNPPRYIWCNTSPSQPYTFSAWITSPFTAQPSSSSCHHPVDLYRKNPWIAFRHSTRSFRCRMSPRCIVRDDGEAVEGAFVRQFHVGWHDWISCWPEEGSAGCERHDDEDGECAFDHRSVSDALSLPSTVSNCYLSFLVAARHDTACNCCTPLGGGSPTCI